MAAFEVDDQRLGSTSIVLIDSPSSHSPYLRLGRYTRRLHPLGDGKRINLFGTPRRWRTGRQCRLRSFPFADEEVLSCAIAMRKLWHARCAMP
jgi:hypothetical protein